VVSDKLKEQADTDPWKRTPPWILPEDGDPIDRLWKLYAQARVEPDRMKRIALMWEIQKIHIDDGPFFYGQVANYPRLVLVRDGLKNVPTRENLALGGWVNPWIPPSPAVYDPETYFWDKPDEHA
jgi:peptide/nickel transport system substrate-binding protein